MDKTFDEVFEAYFQKFGDVFPMMEYDLPDEEAIARMQRCLKEEKPAGEIWPLRKDVNY